MKSKILISFPILVLIFIAFLRGSETRSQTQEPVAIKVAEVGNERIVGEIAGAFLDDLAAHLEGSPDAKGLIVAYGPEGERSGSGKYWLNRASDYLQLRIHTRERIISVYGGLGSSILDTRLEFWFVPAGATLPKPAPGKIDLNSFEGRVGGGWALEGPEVYDPGGPAPGYVTMAAFAQILLHQPKSIGYVVAHSNASPGAWRRIAKYNVQSLGGYGIAAERLKIFHGKNADKPGLEFWVLPETKSLPLVEAPPDRLGKKAALIHEYYEYQLSYPEDQELAFKGFADLLKEYPAAKLCFVITPPFPPDKNEEASNDPKVDYRAIVEKWRKKLISELKINPNRIVVKIPLRIDEIFYGKMYAWIVPANAALPAPPKIER